MKQLARLAERLYNTPLLLTMVKAEIIEAVFRAHVEGRAEQRPQVEVREELPREMMVGSIALRRSENGYYVTGSGVAVVPVHGSMIQRGGGMMDSMSGLTGYNQLGSMIAAAERDGQVRGIMLEIDSPGGEVAGVFELASLLEEMSKPVWAHANEYAASAAYLLGSAADKLYAPQTGMVGSVGVVMLHVDKSRQAEKAGITYTPIFAGARKVDGASFAPLSDDARASAQARVDSLYTLFVDRVSASRGISADAVRGTEAAVMSVQDATDMGMADGVATLGETIQMFTDEINANAGKQFKPKRYRAEASQLGDSFMKTAANQPAATTTAAAPAPETTAAVVETTTAAANPAPQANAVAPGGNEVQTAERARISGILNHTEADGRKDLANHLAFNTDMTVDAAATILKASNKAVQAAANPLAAAMGSIANPQVGADGTVTAAAAGGDGKGKVVRLDSKTVYERRQQKANK